MDDACHRRTDLRDSNRGGPATPGEIPDRPHPAYVYLDPSDPPREIMVSWNDGCWEHRAFWGEDLIPYGQGGTSSRRDRGALPAAGGWVRLEVPAQLLGLEGAQLKGMSFTLVDGSATWAAAGRRSGPPLP